ncbi:MAG TPA: DUF4142 domain-containing protein [Gemmatimonadales bacterium]
MNDSPYPGVARVVTPGQGTMVAPWYRLPPPPLQPAHDGLLSGGYPRWLLGALGAGSALAVFLVLSDPASQPATTSSSRASAGPARELVAVHGGDAPAAEAPAARAVLASRQLSESRLATIDGTLMAAVAGSELAALRAHDVALRAFAAQQAARYAELRSTLHAFAGRPVEATPAGSAAVDGAPYAAELAALGQADGPEFDRLYVSHALELNRALLVELDGALATIDDVELRDAVERMRGSMRGDLPAEAARPRHTDSPESRDDAR